MECTGLLRVCLFLILGVQFSRPQTIDQIILSARQSPGDNVHYRRGKGEGGGLDSPNGNSQSVQNSHLVDPPKGPEHYETDGYPGPLGPDGDVDGYPMPGHAGDIQSNTGITEHSQPETSEQSTVTVEYDMIFTRATWNRIQFNNRRRHRRKAIVPGMYKLDNRERPVSRWTNKEIPYLINPIFNSTERANMYTAMAEWQRFTCIQFVPKTPQHSNYIEFVNGPGCSSWVGMAGHGRQSVELGPGCRQIKVIIHELGHAIGFFHEQSRPDREHYVKINYGNIMPGQENQFNKFDSTTINTHNIPYDYLSIMHYGAYFSSARGCRTIETRDERYQHSIGKAETVSFNDIKLANILYACNYGCEPKQCPSDGFQGKDCKCWCEGNPVRECNSVFRGAPMALRAFHPDVRVDKDERCASWAQWGECEINPKWMVVNCPLSCDNCVYPDNSGFYHLRETMSMIAAGPAGVFGRNPRGIIYYLWGSRGAATLSNEFWDWVNRKKFQTVAVGKNILAGITRSDKLFFRMGMSDNRPRGRNWTQSNGRFKQVTLSEYSDQLWGISNTGRLLFMPQVTASDPVSEMYAVESNCSSVGIGKFGIWIVKTNGSVFYKNHNEAPVEAVTSNWNKIDSDVICKQVSAEGSERWVICLDSSGQMFARTGITPSRPSGTGWKRIDFNHGRVAHVSVYRDQLWFTTEENKTFTKPLTDAILT